MQARCSSRERSFRVAAVSICICSLFLFARYSCFAQQPTEDRAISASELAKDNLDRVAASESQITAVLNANPGLFVELKRWVAKDAADRGQIVKDSDLTDSAIFSRLANDLRLPSRRDAAVAKLWLFASQGKSRFRSRPRAGCSRARAYSRACSYRADSSSTSPTKPISEMRYPRSWRSHLPGQVEASAKSRCTD